MNPLRTLQPLVLFPGPRSIVYHREIPGVFEVSSEAARLIAACGTGARNMDELVRESELPSNVVQEILRELEESWVRAETEPTAPVREWPGCVTDLRLFVSLDCNMSCEHCYVSAGSSHRLPRDMDRATADAAVDWIQSVALADRVRLRFFGGEPMLNFDLVLYAADRAVDALGVGRVSLVLNTNGSLITKREAQSLRERGFQVVLSLDAAPGSAGGTGHPFSPAALSGLRHLVASGCPLTVSSVIHHAWEPDSFMRFLGDEGVHYVGVNERRFVGAPATEEEARHLAQRVLKAWSLGKQLGITVGGEWRWLLRRLDTESGYRPLAYCAGHGTEASVMPDGSVFSCGASTLQIGSVLFPDALSNPSSVDALRRRRDRIAALCASCDIYRLCLGGCAADAMRRCGDVNAVTGCSFRQETVKAFLSEFAKGEALEPPQLAPGEAVPW